jgi:hypothetical protein
MELAMQRICVIRFVVMANMLVLLRNAMTVIWLMATAVILNATWKMAGPVQVVPARADRGVISAAMGKSLAVKSVTTVTLKVVMDAVGIALQSLDSFASLAIHQSLASV